ncbi:hypothetical protein [Roseicyclus persicicus]|uniref:Uncharacterized protein n=1 Tax=Roseicyclus persicicus TaxID=2650661 RepID=A0A7X6GX38_9RHOB|nr:hypothetical protein [Roseibacterium persicicum]NKX43997.1 hypothetical protein [Roseibacterium persicicum]
MTRRKEGRIEIQLPRIAMSPAELPPQRLHTVVDLPPRPDGFEPSVTFGAFPGTAYPRHRPRRLRYLGSVEWAWSPAHNRFEAYHLHRGRGHWCLYIRDLDPLETQFTWLEAAYVDRRGVDERTAAIHLMIAMWEVCATDYEMERFHWINEEAFLSVEEWMAIARMVWVDILS